MLRLPRHQHIVQHSVGLRHGRLNLRTDKSPSDSLFKGTTPSEVNMLEICYLCCSLDLSKSEQCGPYPEARRASGPTVQQTAYRFGLRRKGSGLWELILRADLELRITRIWGFILTLLRSGWRQNSENQTRKEMLNCAYESIRSWLPT